MGKVASTRTTMDCHTTHYKGLVACGKFASHECRCNCDDLGWWNNGNIMSITMVLFDIDLCSHSKIAWGPEVMQCGPSMPHFLDN